MCLTGAWGGEEKIETAVLSSKVQDVARMAERISLAGQGNQ